MDDRRIPHFFSLYPTYIEDGEKKEKAIDFKRLLIMKQYSVLPAKAFRSRKLPIVEGVNYSDANATELTVHQKKHT